MCVTYRNDKKGISPSQAFVSSELLCITLGGVLAPQELVQLPALQRRFAESRTGLQELRAATQHWVEHPRWGSWVGRAQLVALRGEVMAFLSFPWTSRVAYVLTPTGMFLHGIPVSALRYQTPSNKELRSMKRKGLSQECMFPRAVLLLNVLEETQDPFIGPVAGHLLALSLPG